MTNLLPVEGPGVLDAYRSRAIVGCVITFTITSTISLILRIIAKRKKKTPLCAEDWVIVAAQIAIYGMAACSIMEVVLGGAGHHVWEVPNKITSFLKVLIAMQVFYGTTLGLIKISICLFLNRIFAIREFRVWGWAAMGLITAWSIMVILTAFVLCTPFAFNWNNTIPGGKCANQPAAFLAIGILDLVVDVVVLVLPLPMIWNLHLPVGNKIGLFAIFGVGMVTMVIACLRIHALHTVSYTDITYTAAYPVLWSFSEPAIGISVACAPLLRPLFKGTRIGHLFSKSKNVSGKSSGKDSSFLRLDEQPLSDMKPHSLVTVSGGRPRTGTPESLESLAEDTTGITVKREWHTQNV